MLLSIATALGIVARIKPVRALYKMNYVIYYRVSTKRQGESGLGLDAQKRDIEIYLENHAHNILAEFEDIQSGKDANRDGYRKAVALAKKTSATLLVAKLDRISRDVETIAGLIKRVTLKVACMPQADNFQLHIYAALAHQEREFISQRTKSALKAAKQRGVRLGKVPNEQRKAICVEGTSAIIQSANTFAKDMAMAIRPMRESGTSYSDIAKWLNARNMPTQRGKDWTATGVRNICVRLSLLPQLRNNIDS